MKTQILLLFFTSICLLSNSQTRTATAGPCTDSMVQNTKGEWAKPNESFSQVSPAQKQEINNRLNILHNILLKMYPPHPIGVDIVAYRGSKKGFFAATRKYSFNQDNVLSFDYVSTSPLTHSHYFANFCRHKCIYGEKGGVFHAGKSYGNGDGISIILNDFDLLADGPVQDDDWTINGLPVRRLTVVKREKWKGYTVYGHASGNAGQILLHREGILPYIPVTRKQYLDRCIDHLAQLHDKFIESAKQIPVRSAGEQEKEKNAKLEKFQKQFANDTKKLKANVDFYLAGYKTDQQIKDERVAKSIEIKEKELQKFRDELEKTTREGLLDAPALIMAMYYATPAVFETDPQKGVMLITENPGYIRKDLPGYIPQIMVLKWVWNSENFHSLKLFEKQFLQDFPVEKLQAMIDK